MKLMGLTFVLLHFLETIQWNGCHRFEIKTTRRRHDNEPSNNVGVVYQQTYKNASQNNFKVFTLQSRSSKTNGSQRSLQTDRRRGHFKEILSLLMIVA